MKMVNMMALTALTAVLVSGCGKEEPVATAAPAANVYTVVKAAENKVQSAANGMINLKATVLANDEFAAQVPISCDHDSDITAANAFGDGTVSCTSKDAGTREKIAWKCPSIESLNCRVDDAKLAGKADVVTRFDTANAWQKESVDGLIPKVVR